MNKAFVSFLLFLLSSAFVQAQVAGEYREFPVLHITTADSVMPSYEVIEAPPGLSGVSITGNDYVSGRMVMTLCGDTVYDTGDYVKGYSGMRIRVRGNTTGAWMAQHPYKIKLSEKADLLMRGADGAAHKDWVLLGLYTWHPDMKSRVSNILPLVGMVVGKALKQAYTPERCFVSVELNGKYQGMYHLTETVERGAGRVDIDRTGFLIENDAYWWKEPAGNSFRGPYTDSVMGYTFKYPDPDEVPAAVRQEIADYMSAFETALYADSPSAEMADLESFARWTLIQDVLGVYDAIGTNMFVYRKDASAASRLTMGPAWDFDSAFRCAPGDWSSVHGANGHIFYIRRLFAIPEFLRCYTGLWEQEKDEIYVRVAEMLDAYERACGETFGRSAARHEARYPGEVRNTLREQVDEVLEKLRERLTSLDTMIGGLASGMKVPAVGEGAARVYDLGGRDCTPLRFEALPPGIYIECGPDGLRRKVFRK